MSFGPRSTAESPGLGDVVGAESLMDFGEVGDGSVPPAFPWTGEPPLGVALPELPADRAGD